MGAYAARTWQHRASPPGARKYCKGSMLAMIPIDAMTNLGFEDIMKVIDQLNPIRFQCITLKGRENSAAFAKEHYPVRKLPIRSWS
jgi:hypothetical protein